MYEIIVGGARVQGFLLDEGMMFEDALMSKLVEACTEIPLDLAFRRRHALATFGFRGVIFFGDLRQLPPANDTRPF